MCTVERLICVVMHIIYILQCSVQQLTALIFYTTTHQVFTCGAPYSLCIAAHHCDAKWHLQDGPGDGVAGPAVVQELVAAPDYDAA